MNRSWPWILRELVTLAALGGCVTLLIEWIA